MVSSLVYCNCPVRLETYYLIQMGWSSLQILVFQLACLIQVTDNVQEILLWELHAGKMEHQMIKCFLNSMMVYVMLNSCFFCFAGWHPRYCSLEVDTIPSEFISVKSLRP